MLHHGVSIEDGGGWTPEFLAGFIVHLSGVVYVLSS